MRKSLFVALIAAVLIAVPLFASEASGDAESNETVTVEGYIVHNGVAIATTMDVVLYEKISGVYVELCTETVNLDSDGYFYFTCDEVTNLGNDFAVKLVEKGYTVSESNLGNLELDADGEHYKIKGGVKGDTLTISEENSAVGMVKAKGTITGIVHSASGDKPILNGAKISLMDKEGKKLADTMSEGQGRFYLRDIPIFHKSDGCYLVVEKNGFDSRKIMLDDEDLAPEEELDVYDIELNPNDKMDSAHLMSIAGILCALLLIVMVVCHIARKR